MTTWRRLAPLAAAIVATAGAAAARDYDPALAVDHAPFDALLRKYVAPDGVRYRDWAASDADRTALKEYVATLAGATPSGMARYERLAFWLNAYNALTLDLVLDHYPVKSIKDIGSPWKRTVIAVEGRDLSLDEIENDIVRPTWRDPRVHFALNCASVSCPPLRAEAYDGRRVDEQLEEQTVAFLGDRATNFVDGRGKLHLSKIFRWYGDDFRRDGRSVADWVRPYIEELAARPRGEKVAIDYGGYDWRLNEAGAAR